MEISEKSVTTRDGIRLSGLLYLPDTQKPPIIILLHGFAGNKDENGLFIEVSKYFINKGIAVFRYDFRGIGQSEGDYRDITLNIMVNDFRDVMFDLLSDRRLSRRIGVLGFSLGATIAILGYHSLINTLVFWNPVFFTDIDLYPRYNTQEIRNNIEKYGYIKKTHALVGPRLISDFKHCLTLDKIKQIRVPVLIFQAQKDERINMQNTNKAYKYFESTKNIHIVGSENHTFSKYSINRHKMYDITAKWISKYSRNRLKKSDYIPPVLKPVLFDAPAVVRQ